MGWNANGLCDKTHFESCLKRARRSGVDAIMVQEHKWKEGSYALAKARSAATSTGWELWVRGSEGARGGTAILIDKHSKYVTSEGNPKYLAGGRVTIVDATVDGERTRLASVYAPVAAGERKGFVRKMRSEKLWRKSDLIFGDFNCVPDVNLDVKGNPDYPNAEGSATEAVFSDHGLTDVFRLYAGNERAYSRHGKTVWTRLDRLYAQKLNSPWRWIGVRYDAALMTGSKASDHAALIAQLETAPKREATEVDARIDANLLRDEETREDIKVIWRAKYKSFAGRQVKEGQKWAAAKKAVASYLFTKTALARKKRATKADMLRSSINELHGEAGWDGPEKKYDEAKKQLEKAVAKEEKKGGRLSQWWSYVSSLREELSSKTFYRSFKRKHASPDISSLHKTPDWEKPDVKEGITQSAEETAEELRKYYNNLFDPKNSDPLRRKRFLKALRGRQISKASRNKLEKPIEEKELRLAIRSMASGKAPGPDGLGAEFYKEFEDTIVHDMLRMVREAMEDGAYHVDVRTGHIIVLHKKEDTREIRNYRPITLLQLDYKIVSKVMVARLGAVMDEIVSSSQLGFVPGRVITEATHLVKLVQALAEEEDGEGLLIAADWEKAFDRVSWDYLHEAVKALGFGPEFQNWVGVMYNPHARPVRQVKTNGVLSEPFEICSGTPQGCPASPLIFLLVAEALTRVVMEDEQLEGYQTASGVRVKLSQFADDTQFLLRGFEELARMWAHIDDYEAATGMRANKKKFEGLRLGATRRQKVPENEFTEGIRWVGKGQYMMILGIPFGEEFDEATFLEKKYSDTKALLAVWRDHVKLTVVGRAMLANSMIFSRFRYYAQSMVFPSALEEAIVEDAEALVWAKDFEFDAVEIGTDVKFKRFMKKGAQHGNRKQDLGVGLLPWPAHVRSLQAMWILKYRDASRGDWKLLLDAWFARTEEGRGAPFTQIARSKLTASTTQRRCALPKFWVQALKAVRIVPLVRAHPMRWETEEARGNPIWGNPAFGIRVAREAMWRRRNALTIKDAFYVSKGRDYTDEEIISFFDMRYYRDSAEVGFWVGNKILKFAEILKDWKKITSAIPTKALRAAKGEIYSEAWRYSDQAIQMMEKMGWKPGGGLGKHGEGRRELIATPRPRQKQVAVVPQAPTDPRRAIKFVRAKDTRNAAPAPSGSGGAQIVPEKNEARFFAANLGGFTYFGKINKYGLEVWEPTTKGILRKTNDTRLIAPGVLREVAWWGHKPIGAAESTFPDPLMWRFEGLDTPLDQVTVRLYTRMQTAMTAVAPSCLEAWRKRIGSLPSDVGERYNTALLTPRDWASHFKNVLHRTLMVRSITTGEPCRCCGFARENLTHFAECEVAGKIFEDLREMAGVAKLVGEEQVARFALFALLPKGKVAKGWVNFHLLLWKHLVAAIVRVELEGEKFECKNVWAPSWVRFEKKTLALAERVAMEKRRADGRGAKCRDLSSRSAQIEPLAEFSENGELVWNDDLVKKIKALACIKGKKGSAAADGGD